MSKLKYTLFWFRRDLRLEDNRGLFHALTHHENVVPIFIFDSQILKNLKDKQDLRVQFIHQTLLHLKQHLNRSGTDLWVFHGKPLEVFQKLYEKNPFIKIYTNHDYEPYARQRDEEVRSWVLSKGLEFQSFKDQVIFEKSDILTDSKKPYTVYTPYKRKWLATLTNQDLQSYQLEPLFKNWANFKTPQKLMSLQDIGFEPKAFQYPKANVSSETLRLYEKQRDFPYHSGTSHLGLHFRFGTVSIREMARKAKKEKFDVWLSELIWREFFMQILWHYPHVATESFRPEYEKVAWRESQLEFERWCRGQTGFPLVDAGMRELNQTGYMHNRVRMVVASFLSKHLLMHWLKGERYFAEKLLDFDLSANNGNWQWAAGTGCDAAPYFRVFNPEAQMKKFDPKGLYVKKWIPEWGTSKYPVPMVDHKEARERCLAAFQKALKK